MGLDVWRPKREDIMKPFLVFLMAFMAITTSEAMSLGNKDEAGEQNASEAAEDDSDWMQYLNNRFEKRFDPSDPKSLFGAVYGSNYRSKRFDPSDPRSLFSAVYSNYSGGYKKRYDPVGDLYGSYKRAYKPNDPRSLFRAVYGYRK